jgi:hypothetical protein
MKNIYKIIGGLVVLGLFIILWPREPQNPPVPLKPLKNALKAATPRIPARLPALRPRGEPGKPPEGQFEIQPSVKSDLARVLSGDVKLPALDPAVVERYLERHKRSAQSLLGAYRTTQNLEFLKEAAARYPDDPMIQMAVLRQNLFPEQRREWLERLKRSAPDNSLVAYLSAHERFAAKDFAGALADLGEATKRPQFNPYLLESMQNVQELLVAGGRPPILAGAESMFSADMGHLGRVKQLSTELVQLCQQYQTAGDAESAGAVAYMGLMLAARLNGSREGQFIVDKLVGIAIENQVWSLFDPTANSHYPGVSVQARRDELTRQRDALKSLTADFPPTLLGCSDDEIIAYLDRVKVLGEVEALRWLKSKQPAR